MVIGPNATLPKGHLPHRNVAVTPRGKALLELVKMGTPRLHRARYALEHARDFYDHTPERWTQGAHWLIAPHRRADSIIVAETQPYAACLQGAVCLRKREGAGFLAAHTPWRRGSSGWCAREAVEAVLRALYPAEPASMASWNDEATRKPEEVFDLIDETLELIELVVGRRKKR